MRNTRQSFDSGSIRLLNLGLSTNTAAGEPIRALICCDPDQADRGLFWASLVLAIFPCRVCSFTSRLLRGWTRPYLPLPGALGVIQALANPATISQPS